MTGLSRRPLDSVQRAPHPRRVAGSSPDLIFISYRRDDAGDYATRLFEVLVTAFGANRVFMNHASIRKGHDDWQEKIHAALRRAGVMLAIIGPIWATVERGGQPRLHRDAA